MSSQSFIRALKAPSEPGGLSKIELSRSVWDDTSFYVPNKGEVIVDWILTRLLKDRTKNSETNPVLDCRFWELLGDIITTRPVKTWLSPLLSHISIASIAITFLNLLASIDNVARQRLADVALRCFRILWPLGVHKLTAETLSDCFGTVLATFQECESNESLAHISLIMTSSFRTSLGNALNKKKLHITFTQTQLHMWMECASVQSCLSNIYGSLLDAIYAAGVETLFNLDTLRQQHSRSEDTLFQALIKDLGTFPSLAITVLPRIFNSYIQCIKKHRGALFSQSSSQPSGSASEELRFAAMNFFASCCSVIEHAGDNDHSWTARVALLSIVDSENLFSATQPDIDQLLKRNGELAILALSSAGKGDHTGDTKFAIDILSTLTRIDYDLVVPAIPRILPKILLVHWPLQIPELNKSTSVFLDLLLDYHVKTRTLHIYIQYLFAALAQPSAFSSNPQSLYQAASTGPLLSSNHLGKLGKCVHSFMASGQIVETVRKVFHSLKDIWEQFDGGECSRKRGKVEAATGKGGDAEALAVSFSLSARTASVVLRSLPVQSVPGAVQRDVQTLVDEAQTTFFRTCLAQTVAKHARDCRDVWGSQIIAAATLRFQYVLEASRGINLQSPDPKLSTKILDMLNDDEILPELHLEMFRILLAHSAQGILVESKVLLDSLFDYLGRYFNAGDLSWCGLSCQLTLNERGKKEAALALFHLMIDRWLPVVDRIASRQHLERLAHLLLSIHFEEDRPSSVTDIIRPSTCLEQALRSAELWELPNMRNIFVSVLINKTSTLDEADTSKICSSDMQHAISAYHTLLFMPIEYISRTARTDFVRRALTADVVFSNSMDCRPLTILRAFLKRVFVYLGTVDQTTGHQFLEHLLNTSNSVTVELSLVTLDLIEIHFLSLLRSSERQAILDMLKTLATSLPDASSNGQVKQRAFVRLISLLGTSFPPSRFPDEIQAAMIELRECLLVIVLPQMMAVTAEGAVLDHKTLRLDLFTIWYQILSFGRCLSLNDVTPKFGRRLVTQMLSSSCSLDSADERFEDMSAATLIILLEELYLYSEADRLQHVEVIVAAYVSLSRKFGSYRLKKFDDYISKTCKFFSALDFSRFLDVVAEGLVSSSYDSEVLGCLTHLSVLLLHEVPQGTLQSTQSFTTRSLNIFSDQHIFNVGPSSLRLQVLDFVDKHCSDRPAALRSVDLNSIWSLLSKFLTKSREHDETTLTPIFHKIANIISTVIRFRRDLVVMTLPHLGMILRQMIMSIRGVRPQLGAKQSKLVAETLPRWINTSQPLTTHEGKVLARLLVTLTTKNIIRTHSPHIQKAESLAKPFSKHAAYVLKAYIEVMNDPLCIVSYELRRELEPGLFALCSMLSEHSRDAMMVSALDAGGKTTFKSLWREYEKQKYVGKG